VSVDSSTVSVGVRPGWGMVGSPSQSLPTSTMRLRTFNQLDRPLAVTLLRSCLDADRWVEEVVDRRPFTSLEALLETARRVSPLSAPEVERICSTLWTRAVVSSPVMLAGSPLPRPQPETSATAQLAELLLAYQHRFGRPFLIRTAGRSWDDIAKKMRIRLRHSPEQENVVVAAELSQMALLRLVRLIHG
jgi:2-oxo-4-hydroxy-4-carboxy-5-ureidoimidazoline decarboxylase